MSGYGLEAKMTLAGDVVPVSFNPLMSGYGLEVMLNTSVWPNDASGFNPLMSGYGLEVTPPGE